MRHMRQCFKIQVKKSIIKYAHLEENILIRIANRELVNLDPVTTSEQFLIQVF